MLNWAVLSGSFFNTICLLWLGLMVLLIGDRRSPGAWLTGGGLLLGALFFTSHTAILGRGLGSVSFGMNFWWWVSWAPAVVAPLAWYGALLWYAGYRTDRPHPHRAWLAVVLTLTGLIVLLLIFANPLPTYQYVAGRMVILTPGIAGVPLLVLAYILYSLLCYLLPLDLLRRASGGPTRADRARQRARPWLAGASLGLLLAGGTLSWAALWALTTRPLPSLTELAAQTIVLRFDLAVQVLIGLSITLLGRAIVGFEVFTARPLPRTGFFRHWRSTIILAAGFGAVAAWTLTIDLRPIYSLMLAIALMVFFYALYCWRSFADHEAFMARLRPFVASQDLYGHLISRGHLLLSPALPEKTEPALPESRANLQAQFETLCREILDVRSAVLIPAGSLATLAGPGLVYPADALLPAWEEVSAWFETLTVPQPGGQHEGTGVMREGGRYEYLVPLWMQAESAQQPNGASLCGLLLLDEKTNRAPLNEEEMEVAQAAGERLIDSLAGAEMARLALDLLRQRLAQTRVLEGQGRRVLHDEVLPELHTAILYLSAHAGQPEAQPDLQQALHILTGAHQRIAGLMRELPLATPHRLASAGFAAALQDLLAGPFAGRFDRVEWEIDPAAEERSRTLPLYAGEVVFFAARELLRNAADHARGDGPGRMLCVRIALRVQADSLVLLIEDDGVGVGHQAGDPEGAGPHGSGLRIHTALLAAIGASLSVSPRPGGGTTVRIIV